MPESSVNMSHRKDMADLFWEFMYWIGVCSFAALLIFFLAVFPLGWLIDLLLLGACATIKIAMEVC